MANKQIPTKEELIYKLNDIVNSYEVNENVRASDVIRAIETMNKMLGYNEERDDKDVPVYIFEPS